ncbi:MAG: DUF3726 domain-containing protein [Pseudomonadales bacterium]
MSASHVQASSNELTALLKRVFEAIGCDQSEQEDAAKAILAAECRGFSAFCTLPEMLERLQRERPKPIPRIDEKNGWLEIDGNRSSIACYGSVFAGLTSAYAAQRDQCVFASVQSCNDRSMVLHFLQSNAAAGVPMLASWSNDHEPDTRCAYLASNDGLNDQYIEQELSEKNSSPECLILMAAPCFEQILPFWQQIHAQYSINKAVAATEIQNRLDLSRSNGIRIEMPLWEQLQKIALNVLVPSSERSRAGAGA